VQLEKVSFGIRYGENNMIPRQNIQTGFISVLILILLFNCSTEKKDISEFYIRNKENVHLLSFDAVQIAPARGIYTIKLLKYSGVVFKVIGYDESKEPPLDIINGEENFKLLNKEFNLDHDSTMKYLSNLYSIFKDLDVRAVFGMPDCMYIKFVMDDYNVVVYVPDRSKITTSVMKDLEELEKKARIVFDENWFTYRLDKPFSLSG
jgi:hypothetical protein